MSSRLNPVLAFMPSCTELRRFAAKKAATAKVAAAPGAAKIVPSAAEAAPATAKVAIGAAEFAAPTKASGTTTASAQK